MEVQLIVDGEVSQQKIRCAHQQLALAVSNATTQLFLDYLLKESTQLNQTNGEVAPMREEALAVESAAEKLGRETVAEMAPIVEKQLTADVEREASKACSEAETSLGTPENAREEQGAMTKVWAEAGLEALSEPLTAAVSNPVQTRCLDISKMAGVRAGEILRAHTGAAMADGIVYTRSKAMQKEMITRIDDAVTETKRLEIVTVTTTTMTTEQIAAESERLSELTKAITAQEAVVDEAKAAIIPAQKQMNASLAVAKSNAEATVAAAKHASTEAHRNAADSLAMATLSVEKGKRETKAGIEKKLDVEISAIDIRRKQAKETGGDELENTLKELEVEEATARDVAAKKQDKFCSDLDSNLEEVTKVAKLTVEKADADEAAQQKEAARLVDDAQAKGQVLVTQAQQAFDIESMKLQRLHAELTQGTKTLETVKTETMHKKFKPHMWLSHVKSGLIALQNDLNKQAIRACHAPQVYGDVDTPLLNHDHADGIVVEKPATDASANEVPATEAPASATE